MDLSTISESAWQWFEKTYPDAHSFLLRESLYGEWQHLRNRPIGSLNDWGEKRLEELTRLMGERTYE